MPFELQRCEIIPMPEHQTAFLVDGMEKIRWLFSEAYQRPFFYPFPGPSGSSLTRMGHPGAPNHDHHRSVWFAHHDIDGNDFWSNHSGTQVVQKMWLSYRDGMDECVMTTLLEWRSAKKVSLMEQELTASLIPLGNGELLLELQSTFTPAGPKETVTLGKTNFGFLAVRMAKTISSFFGGGVLTNSEGMIGEPAIFGQSAEWMDYSGPVPLRQGDQRKTTIEGITYFDHPDNPRYPTHWHVREDGWMGASFCMNEKMVIEKDSPLTLRYLLHSHSGPVDMDRARKTAQDFAQRPGFVADKDKSNHHQFEKRSRGAI